MAKNQIKIKSKHIMVIEIKYSLGGINFTLNITGDLICKLRN